MNLSIIVPVYNVENYLVRCIDSILNQDLDKSKYEIILINDGSTDNSYSIAKKIAKGKSNIKLFTQNNIGIAATRNVGIKLAKGKYLSFVDSDDYIASNTLKLLLQCIIDNNLEVLEYNFIRTKSRNLLSSKNINNLKNFDIKITDGQNYISSRNFSDCVWSYFYNLEFLLKSKVRFVEGKVMEDTFFTAEIISKSKRIAYYPLDVNRWVITPNSITTSTNSKKVRKAINDHVYMVNEFSKFIIKLENNHFEVTKLKIRQQQVLFNISKRILQSDLKFSEISQIMKSLSINKLYPSKGYNGKDKYVILLTFFYNKKYLFFLLVSIYRIFKVPIEKYIINKHNKKKEKKLLLPVSNSQ